MTVLKVSDISKTFRDKSSDKDKLKDYSPIIKQFKKLTIKKEYKKALENVSFEVKKGEIFGLLGPNGAGKTTLIKIMSGLMESNSGKVTLLDENIPPDVEKIKKDFNVVFSRGAMFWHLSGKDNLELYSEIYEVPNKEEKIQKYLDFFELDDKKNGYVDMWSTGEHMRLKLAKSLLNDPKILFLDEPSLGLDHKIALKVRDFLKKLNKEKGTTMLLTTHFMEEADYLCDRVAIIDKGKIVRIDKPRKLKEELRESGVVEFRLEDFKNELIEKLVKKDYVEDARFIEEEGKIRVILEDLLYSDKLIGHIKKNYKILEFNTDEPTLGDVFIHLTGKKLEDRE
ncbi:MAG: ATP-binding cassette domain-containing protein [Candidatus Aenigmatarchaeota archaeon]